MQALTNPRAAQPLGAKAACYLHGKSCDNLDGNIIANGCKLLEEDDCPVPLLSYDTTSLHTLFSVTPFHTMLNSHVNLFRGVRITTVPCLLLLFIFQGGTAALKRVQRQRMICSRGMCHWLSPCHCPV
jgi:hypothetical protein